MAKTPLEKKTPLGPASVFFSSGWFCLFFLAPFGFYLAVLGPAFMDGDSPETALAGFQLGLPHPPGYALDLLWTRLFTLLPLGGPALRASLGSAFLACLGTVLLAALIREIGGALSPDKKAGGAFPLWAAAAGALLLAFSRSYGEAAVSPKSGVYLLQTCLGMALVFFRCRGGASFFLAVFLLALGFTNHWETQLFFIPLLFWGCPFPRPFDFKFLSKSGSFCLLGISPLLYLPLRAHLHPALNMGWPDSLPRFISYISRKYYASAAEWSSLTGLLQFSDGVPPKTQALSMLHRAHAVFLHFETLFAWPLLFFAFVGVVFAPKPPRGSQVRWLLWLPLGLSLALTAIYTPPSADWLLDHFLLASDWVPCLFAGLGAFVLWEKTKGSSWRWFFPAALCLAPLGSAWTNWNSLDQRDQTTLYDYGTNLLKSAPRNSVFFAESDNDYFSIDYLQLVEKKRPDLVMIPSFTLFETWGAAQVERLHPELGLTASAQNFPDPIARLIYSSSEIVVKNRDRIPVVFSYFDGAFHRYYLGLHPGLQGRRSGAALVLDSPGGAKGPFLNLSQLRLRHPECPTHSHPSLEGIRGIYQNLGL